MTRFGKSRKQGKRKEKKGRRRRSRAHLRYPDISGWFLVDRSSEGEERKRGKRKNC